MMKRTFKFLTLNIVLVLLDQLTKQLATAKLRGTDGISVIDGVFKLQYLENRGAAFGMLQDKMLFFIISTILILALVIFAYYKLPDTKRFRPLSYIFIFISAGAIGNFIDRLVNQYVTDFLYFELIDFPIFNVADCYVTISAALFLVLVMFYYKDEDFNFLNKKESKAKADKDVPHEL